MVEITDVNAEKHIREFLDSSYEGGKRLFVLVYQVSVDSFKQHFLPRVKIENCNIGNDGRNFYDHQIKDSIEQYDEVRKVSTGQWDAYTTGC